MFSNAIQVYVQGIKQEITKRSHCLKDSVFQLAHVVPSTTGFLTTLYANVGWIYDPMTLTQYHGMSKLVCIGRKLRAHVVLGVDRTATEGGIQKN